MKYVGGVDLAMGMNDANKVETIDGRIPHPAAIYVPKQRHR